MTGVGRREIGHGALAERAISAVLPKSTSLLTRCASSPTFSNRTVLRRWPPSAAPVWRCSMQASPSRARLPELRWACERRRRLRHSHRHCRRRRSLWRHGFQSRRNTQGNYRTANGYQDRRVDAARFSSRQWSRLVADGFSFSTRWMRLSTGPHQERSQYAPRIETVQIPTDKIRDLIGKGGATIRGIVEQTGAKIDVDDTGRVSVASSDADGLKKALAMINDITAVPEIGQDISRQSRSSGRVWRIRRAVPGHRWPASHLRDCRTPREGSEG